MDAGLAGPMGTIVTGQVTWTTYDLTQWGRGLRLSAYEAEVLIAF